MLTMQERTTMRPLTGDAAVTILASEGWRLSTITEGYRLLENGARRIVVKPDGSTHSPLGPVHIVR